MKIAQLRGAFHLLQPIEFEGNEIVVQSGIENERSTLLQGGSGQRDVPGYLFPWVAGKNLVDGGKANLGPHLGEQGFVVALGSLLAGQLQVALVLAVQVAFQNVPGDLRCHDCTRVCGSVRPFIGVPTSNRHPFPGSLALPQQRRARPQQQVFHIRVLANTDSSSVLKSDEMLREANRVIIRFAGFRATVS